MSKFRKISTILLQGVWTDKAIKENQEDYEESKGNH